jgi:malate dehydrogenase (oxaloacetate-decarboxylating)
MDSSSKTRPIKARCRIVSRRGRDVLRNPLLNKSTAFTERERDELGLHGLLPPAVSTIGQQLERTYEGYRREPTPLDKYIFLSALQDRNEVLFYRLVHEHIEEMMPIIYTPTVGEACQRYSHIYRRARGIHLAYEHRERIPRLLMNYHVVDPSIIVVTDGERILGLGDQGAGGMGIPIGKLCLYTLCAGVPPHTTIPITLDVGTDNEERLADPLYLGMRHRRIRGEEYQAFMDEFVASVQKVYPDVLLQWEDFHKENAIKQLDRFRDRICSFNDDIQGTASVALGGLYASMKITRRRLRDETVVMAGAGASAEGISGLIVSAMVEDGLTVSEARRRIWWVDSKGLAVKGRPGLGERKGVYARDPQEIAFPCRDKGAATLAEVVSGSKATILLGTSTQPGLFTEEIVRAMGRNSERPLIFPLSNPTSKAECRPEDAVRWTEGRALVATGSPFPPVEYGGKTHRIGQCNNAFVFPGVGLGAWVGRVRRITDAMFLAAAKAFADCVEPSDLEMCSLYPRLERIRDISHSVACAVIRQAAADGLADPAALEDRETRVGDAMWFPEYEEFRYDPY